MSILGYQSSESLSWPTEFHGEPRQSPSRWIGAGVPEPEPPPLDPEAEAPPLDPEAEAPPETEWPLGIHGNTSTKRLEGSNREHLEFRPDRDTQVRKRRYAMLDVVRDLLPSEGVAKCSLFPVPDEDGANMKIHGGEGKAHFSGLTTCSNVWLCPVCSTRIMAERKAELEAVVSYLRARGHGLLLASVTFPHCRGDHLEDLLGILNDSWSRTKSGGSWSNAKERFGIAHEVTTLEHTHGENGWHPHKHVVLILDHEPTEEQRVEVQDYLNGRFIKFCQKKGVTFKSTEYAVRVTANNDAADYIAKWGELEELTGAQAKDGKGKTPFQLLAAAADGDKEAGQLFQEYAKAVKGRRLMVYSRGLTEIRDGLEPVLPVMRAYVGRWGAVKQVTAKRGGVPAFDALAKANQDYVRECDGFNVSEDAPDYELLLKDHKQEVKRLRAELETSRQDLLSVSLEEIQSVAMLAQDVLSVAELQIGFDDVPVLAELDGDQWFHVACRAKKMWKVLEVAARGSSIRLWEYLKSIGVPGASVELYRQRSQAKGATEALGREFLKRELKERIDEGSYLEDSASYLEDSAW